jgi:hypothetical protein
MWWFLLPLSLPNALLELTNLFEASPEYKGIYIQTTISAIAPPSAQSSSAVPKMQIQLLLLG